MKILRFIFLAATAVACAFGQSFIDDSFGAQGIAGAGFFQVANQSSAPSTPSSAGRYYFNSGNLPAWIDASGNVRLITGSAAALTSGRVPLVTTGGILTDASTLAFNSGTLSVGTAVSVPAVNAAVSMTIGPTSGASKTLTLQSTTSGATATTFLMGNANQTVLMGAPVAAWPGTNGVPQSATYVDNLVTNTVSGNNVMTVMSTSNVGYSAIRFADLNGQEWCAIGYGNPGAGSTFGSNYFIETSGAASATTLTPIKFVQSYNDGSAHSLVRGTFATNGDTIFYDNASGTQFTLNTSGVAIPTIVGATAITGAVTAQSSISVIGAADFGATADRASGTAAGNMQIAKTASGGQGATLQLTNRATGNGGYVQIGFRGFTNASAENDFTYERMFAVDTTAKTGRFIWYTGNGGAPGEALRLDPALLTVAGSVSIAGTSTVTGIRTATATLDFGAILAAGSEDKTITVTGAAVGDSVDFGLPATVLSGAVFNAWVSSASTVTIRCNNAGAVSIDPASATYRATVIQF